jgi:hypothetical protein
MTQTTKPSKEEVAAHLANVADQALRGPAMPVAV